MNRREILKSAPLALVPWTKVNGLDAVEVAPRKFLIFVDACAMDIEALAHADIPNWANIDALFLPVRLREGQTVRDVIQLVEQKGDTNADT